MNTVFGFVALRATHPENLATEALAFILNNSTSASRSFTAFVRSGGIECDELLHFKTQRTGANESRPDMECLGGSGHVQIIVENKFWAGLTDNQPVAYLEEFSSSLRGAVLFVVPEARLSAVWNQIVSKSIEAGLVVGQVNRLPNITVANIAGRGILAITSWRSLLGVLSVASASQADTRAQADIAQLQGLCEAMDNEAFLPLREDELTNLEVPRRIMDYSNLVLEIIRKAELQGHCNYRRAYLTGIYVQMGEYQPLLGFDPAAWRESGASPLWVNFYAPPYSPISLADLRDKLVRFRTATPKRCFDFKDRIAVPLFLRAGVEKEVLVENAAGQLGALAAELGVEQNAQEADAVHTEMRDAG